jgi:hypothetical protein
MDSLLLLPSFDVLLLLLAAQLAEATHEKRDDTKDSRKYELDEVVDHSHGRIDRFAVAIYRESKSLPPSPFVGFPLVVSAQTRCSWSHR